MFCIKDHGLTKLESGFCAKLRDLWPMLPTLHTTRALWLTFMLRAATVVCLIDIAHRTVADTLSGNSSNGEHLHYYNHSAGPRLVSYSFPCAIDLRWDVLYSNAPCRVHVVICKRRADPKPKNTEIKREGGFVCTCRLNDRLHHTASDISRFLNVTTRSPIWCFNPSLLFLLPCCPSISGSSSTRRRP